MKSMSGKIKYNEIIPALAVFSLIISSGANMFLRRIYIFVAILLLIAFYYKKVSPKVFGIGATIIFYIILDSVVFNTASTDYKELMLLIIRIIGCILIVSNITIDQFKVHFLNIIVGLSILSLICFCLICVGIELPGSCTINNNYGTFYHVYSFGKEDIYRRYRNCGIFTEPGIFEIYLNMALLILMTMQDLSVNKMRKIFLLLTITIISTFSSMGYLIYGLVFILYLVFRPDVLTKIRINKKSMIIIALVGIGVILLEEIGVGFITDFVKNTNSFASRHDDTLLTFLMAKDYPIFGIGIATDPIPIWDQYYMRYEDLRLYRSYQKAMSCGLGNYLCMGGIPFTTVYVFSFVRMFYKIMNKKSHVMFLMLTIIIVLFFMEEPLLPTPFFYLGIVSIFSWKNVKLENKTVKEFI